jgi:ATP-binding cassette, subfamily B, bacterial
LRSSELVLAFDDLLKRFPAVTRLKLPGIGGRNRRIPTVRQLSSTDCGAAAIAMVLGYYGRHVPLEELRAALRPGRSGSSLTSLLRVGEKYGLRGRCVSMEMADLASLPPASILHWEFRHFVVFERTRRDSVDIVDPASGERSVSIAAFRRAFTGVALLLEPTDAFETGPGKPKLVSSLFGQLLEHRRLIAQLVTLSVLIQTLSAALPLLTGVLIDRVVPRKDYSLLVLLAASYASLQVFATVVGLAREYLSIHFRTKLELAFTLRFVDHLVDLPYSFFQQRTIGDLMVRLGSNSAVRDILTSALVSTFLDGLMASVYLLLLLIVSIPLTVAVVILAAARVTVLVLARYWQRRLIAESLENQASAQTSQVEMLTGIETLKAMGHEHGAAEQLANIVVDGLNISAKRTQLDAITNSVLQVLSVVTTLALMFYGTFAVLQGTWTVGSMMAFSALAAGFLEPLNKLVSSSLQFQLLQMYLERLNDVLNAPRERDRSLVALAGPLTGGITLDRVSFRYGPQDPVVLKDVSAVIPPGGYIAVVGPTGSGKSTLLKLIAALYEPTSGTICLDGKDLQELDLRSVRSQLGIVTQETHLFGGSLRRNIALSDPTMSLERVIRSAKLACLHEDIIAMPMAYDTLLPDRGLSISGGQRQRLALARAIAGYPKILLLDEATSHLDAVTEGILNRNLASLRCTRVAVAHRLSTVKSADMILVLESGSIVERGCHDELVRLGGRYAALIEAQRDVSREPGVRRA